jgi:putative endonuclease
MYFTYVLYSPDFNKIYVGFSSDLTNRLTAHNDDRNTGWSSRYQPWELLYSEEHLTKSKAMKREKQLKSSKGRDFIWNLADSRKTSL